VGIPIDIARDFAIIALYLQTWGVHSSAVAIAGAIILGSAILVGHIDIKHKIANIEVGVNNRINPHLMKIYEKVNK